MNIANLLARTAERVPDRLAWIYADQGASYRVTRDRVARLAGGLRASGLTPGDRVVLVLPNGPDLFELLWATFWAGLVAVPVNRHLHPHEIAYVVEHSGARALVVAAETAAATSTTDARVQVLHTDADDYSSLASAAPLPMHASQLADPAWLFYTSGTTGRPKGATLTHRNLLAMTLAYYADLDPVADDAVFLHAAPLTHGSGLYLLPAVGHGAVNVISAASRFDPAGYLDLVRKHRVTHGAFLAPTMLTRLTEAAISGEVAQSPSVASLRSLVIGGAALYEADHHRAIKVFGPVITQMYGQGEAPMTIAVMTPRDLPTAATDPPWRSCGRPFTGVEVRIADASGAPCPPGITGEIRVRGDVVMAGYWADPTATAETLTDGWLRTGDVGHFDQAGYLYLTDRSKDVIITGGSNVYPREVEEVLIDHPDVREAAVIGVPDPEWGESVTAYVVLTHGSNATADDLIDHTRNHLASFKKPKHVIFVDDLPKSANGKILKRELRDTVGK